MFKLIVVLTKNTSRVSQRMMSSQEPDVLFKIVKNAGIITLNRPKAFNVVNPSMLEKMSSQLSEWEKTKGLVIIKGAGEKAFCAGGDLKAAVDKVEGPRYFHAFFNISYLIEKYKIPYIAFMNGMTVGGGLGLAAHGRYRVATEKTVAATPECRIGLFPMLYFLRRLEFNLGLYLGLTDDTLKGKDVVKAGIGTHFVPNMRLNELERLLVHCSSDEEVRAVLAKFHEPPDQFSLADNIRHINYCFAASSIEEIIERLESVRNDWSTKTLKTLRQMCPGSLMLTLRALQRCAQLDLPQSLSMQYRMSYHCILSYDFSKGIRALLIDKDNSPKWEPRTLADVTDDYVEKFFKKLPEDQRESLITYRTGEEQMDRG